MSAPTERVVERSGLTLRALIIGVLIWLYIILLDICTYAYALPYPPSRQATAYIVFLVVLLSAIVAFFAKGRGRLTPQEITVIAAMGFPVVTMCILYVQNWLAASIGLFYYPKFEALRPYVPSFWVPPSDAIVNFFEGGPLSWGAWAKPLAFWIPFWFSWYLVLYTLALMFRRLFIDIEKLPFPLTTMNCYVIELLEPKSTRPKLFSKEAKWFWVGFFAAVIIMLPYILNTTFKYLTGKSLGLKLLPYFHYDVHLIKYTENILPSAPVYIRRYVHMWTAMFLFAPLDVLLTAWLWYVVTHFIIVPIEVKMGILPKLSYKQIKTAWHWWLQVSFLKGLKPSIITYGAVFGTLLWLLLVNRGYLAELWRAFRSPSPELDKNEPFSYRTIVGVFIVSSIVFMALMVISGVPVWIAIIIWIVLLALGYANARVRAEASPVSYVFLVEGADRIIFDIGHFAGPSKAAFTSMFFPKFVWGYPFWIWQGPPGQIIDLMALAERTKTRKREVALIALIAGLIGFAVTTILTIYTVHAVGGALRGWKKFHIRWYASGRFTDSILAMLIEGKRDVWTVGSWWPQMLIGIILVPLLGYLRLIWPAFPLHPMGIVLTCGESGFYFWAPILFAWIIKYITLKVGGVQAFEKYVKPCATGIFMGTVMSLIVPAIIGILVRL